MPIIAKLSEKPPLAAERADDMMEASFDETWREGHLYKDKL